MTSPFLASSCSTILLTVSLISSTAAMASRRFSNSLRAGSKWVTSSQYIGDPTEWENTDCNLLRGASMPYCTAIGLKLVTRPSGLVMNGYRKLPQTTQWLQEITSNYIKRKAEQTTGSSSIKCCPTHTWFCWFPAAWGAQSASAVGGKAGWWASAGPSRTLGGPWYHRSQALEESPHTAGKLCCMSVRLDATWRTSISLWQWLFFIQDMPVAQQYSVRLMTEEMWVRGSPLHGFLLMGSMMWQGWCLQAWNKNKGNEDIYMAGSYWK